MGRLLLRVWESLRPSLLATYLCKCPTLFNSWLPRDVLI